MTMQLEVPTVKSPVAAAASEEVEPYERSWTRAE